VPQSKWLKFVVPLAFGGLTACNQELQFTKDPFPGPSPELENKLTPTVVYVGVPVDLEAARAQIDVAFPQELSPIVQLVDNAACGRRNKDIDCNDAKVDGRIVRDGPLLLTTAPSGRVELTVPLRYSWNARGIAWARDITETLAGAFTVTLPYEVVMTPAYSVDVRIKEDAIRWSETQIKVLQKGKLSLPKVVEAKLRKALNGSGETIRKAVADPGMKEHVATAWNALHRPITLPGTPTLWLRSEPEKVFPAGFSTIDGTTYLRMGIGGKYGVASDERPVELVAKKIPEPMRLPDLALTQTSLRLPAVVPLASLKRAVSTAFPKDEVIETTADRNSQPLGVSMKSASVYPSRHHVVIDFTVDISRPRQWLGHTGRAQLLGRPVLRQEDGIIELKDLSFPALNAKDAKAQKKPLRIGQEPFARRFGLVARIDAAAELNAAVERANAIKDVATGDGMVLMGRFAKTGAPTIEIARDGLLLQLPLEGELMLRPVARPTKAGSLAPELAGESTPKPQSATTGSLPTIR
jgi:hypothetical protein